MSEILRKWMNYREFSDTIEQWSRFINRSLGKRTRWKND